MAPGAHRQVSTSTEYSKSWLPRQFAVTADGN
jgi:hypothetical protein